MKFIKEMIMKKSQSKNFVEAVDADLEELRNDERPSDGTEDVPDFTDLIADINQPDYEEDEADTYEEKQPQFVVEEVSDWDEDYSEDLDIEAEVDSYESESPDDSEAEFANPIAAIPEPAETTEVQPPEPVSEAFAPESEQEADIPEATIPKKIWDIDATPENDTPVDGLNEAEQPVPEPVVVQVPTPAIGRSGRRAGRVKTRLLGFEHSEDSAGDVFANSEKSEQQTDSKFPVGWIVISHGPGRGSSFALFNGVSQIGRGEDQSVKLDFGDNSISRSHHAAIAFDNEQSTFFLGHGGKANLVRLNDRPVLSTEELSNGDLIRIGETTLRFVALCGAEFDWERDIQNDGDDVAIA